MFSERPIERQQVYRWVVAIEAFLAGTGAGIYLVSFALDFLGIRGTAVQIGTLLGPLIALSGSVLLVAELGSKSKMYRMYANPRSWMARGTYALTGFILFGLAYAVVGFGLVGWSDASAGRGVGIIGAVSAVLVAAYPGFLFGAARRVPFWGSANLPLIFLLASLYCGVALLLSLDSLVPGSLGAHALRQVAGVGSGLLTLQLLALGAHLAGASQHGVTEADSVRLLLRNRVSVVGFAAVGLLLPLGMLAYSATVLDATLLKAVLVLAALLVLGGGLLLRQGILVAGVYRPLRHW